MGVWTFYDYVVVKPSERIPFRDWMESDVPPAAQAFITVRILTMIGLQRWPEKWISKYKTTDKIYELRCGYMGVQYRPLGVYAPNHSFILLGGGIEKGRIPPSVIETVERRQRLLEENPHHVRTHRFD
jgi:hypothetical protein